MKISFSPFLVSLMLIGCATLPLATANAADPPAVAAAPPAPSIAGTPQIDASAMNLLAKVQTKMQRLKTYYAESSSITTFSPQADGKQHAPTYQQETVIAARPNRMREEYWEMTADASGTLTKKSALPVFLVVSDGKAKWEQIGNNYRTSPLTDTKGLNDQALDGFFNPETSAYGTTEYHRSKGHLQELRSEGSEVVEGVPCQKVTMHFLSHDNNRTSEFRTTWYIGNDDLIHRKVDNFTLTDGHGWTTDTTVRNIHLNTRIADANMQFAYTPPKGMESFEEKEARQPKLLANGVAAPDFAAVRRDGTHVKLSDFRGKVVVVDFWASWCGPCKASMPHNQEVAKKLQAANIPVVLLAVDNSEKQAPFQDWVKTHPEFDALDFVFADPAMHNVSGEDYHVLGIPTQYVIDGQGIIRASSVGFGGPTDDLEKAVRAAAAETAPAK